MWYSTPFSTPCFFDEKTSKNFRVENRQDAGNAGLDYWSREAAVTLTWPVQSEHGANISVYYTMFFFA
jgi:hypothetical protein